MTGQQYSDGWNAAIDRSQEELVRQDQFTEHTLRILDEQRIERPVPTTDKHPPTREQIADRLIKRLRNSGGWPIDEVWQRWQNLFVEYDRDLVLALIQNGADR